MIVWVLRHAEEADQGQKPEDERYLQGRKKYIQKIQILKPHITG